MGIIFADIDNIEVATEESDIETYYELREEQQGGII